MIKYTALVAVASGAITLGVTKDAVKVGAGGPFAIYGQQSRRGLELHLDRVGNIAEYSPLVERLGDKSAISPSKTAEAVKNPWNILNPQ